MNSSATPRATGWCSVSSKTFSSATPRAADSSSVHATTFSSATPRAAAYVSPAAINNISPCQGRSARLLLTSRSRPACRTAFVVAGRSLASGKLPTRPLASARTAGMTMRLYDCKADELPACTSTRPLNGSRPPQASPKGASCTPKHLKRKRPPKAAAGG